MQINGLNTIATDMRELRVISAVEGSSGLTLVTPLTFKMFLAISSTLSLAVEVVREVLPVHLEGET